MQTEPKLEGGRLKGKAANARQLSEVMEKYGKQMEYPVKFTLDTLGATLDYKSVLWIWFKAIAEQLTARSGTTYEDQEIHDIACHKFFGYTEEKTYGEQVIPPQLITITYPRQKTRPELYEFCRNIENWCVDLGVTLPEKPSQYEQDKQKEMA